MFPADFFSKPENAELATLIVMSPLAEKEKRGWLEMLPVMNLEEKQILNKNLREEIEDEMAFQKLSFEALEAKIKELYGKAR